ncbi:MAG: hypothetical protein MZV70_67715 [Desulfobacterales bacterium]|nr:hypothetical protein [Desulfobacterales bacterium]
MPLHAGPEPGGGAGARWTSNLEIPPELYRAVAEVLAFVYRLNGKLKTAMNPFDLLHTRPEGEQPDRGGGRHRQDLYRSRAFSSGWCSSKQLPGRADPGGDLHPARPPPSCATGSTSAWPRPATVARSRRATTARGGRRRAADREQAGRAAAAGADGFRPRGHLHHPRVLPAGAARKRLRDRQRLRRRAGPGPDADPARKWRKTSGVSGVCGQPPEFLAYACRRQPGGPARLLELARQAIRSPISPSRPRPDEPAACDRTLERLPAMRLGPAADRLARRPRRGGRSTSWRRRTERPALRQPANPAARPDATRRIVTHARRLVEALDAYLVSAGTGLPAARAASSLSRPPIWPARP